MGVSIGQLRKESRSLAIDLGVNEEDGTSLILNVKYNPKAYDTMAEENIKELTQDMRPVYANTKLLIGVLISWDLEDEVTGEILPVTEANLNELGMINTSKMVNAIFKDMTPGEK